MDYTLLEINLISAQNLKPPPISSPKHLHSYAIISATATAAATKLRTRIDRSGGPNPTWNDKFIFRLPSSSLSSPSSALDILLFSDGGWCLPDAPVGAVRLLLSNYRLSHHPIDVPLFAAVGIRRPSGRFQGVLNVGFMVLSRVSRVIYEALAAGSAVGYRDLMGRKNSSTALKELNSEKEEEAEEEKENRIQKEMQQLCGLGMRRMQIHLSPSDQNLLNSCVDGDDD